MVLGAWAIKPGFTLLGCGRFGETNGSTIRPIVDLMFTVLTQNVYLYVQLINLILFWVRDFIITYFMYLVDLISIKCLIWSMYSWPTRSTVTLPLFVVENFRFFDLVKSVV